MLTKAGFKKKERKKKINHIQYINYELFMQNRLYNIIGIDGQLGLGLSLKTFLIKISVCLQWKTHNVKDKK